MLRDNFYPIASALLEKTEEMREDKDDSGGEWEARG